MLGTRSLAMNMMTFDLSDSMKRWVEDEAARDGHDDPGEVVRALIRRERERKEKIANMQRLVDEARASGVSRRTADEILADARREAIEAGCRP